MKDQRKPKTSLSSETSRQTPIAGMSARPISNTPPQAEELHVYAEIAANFDHLKILVRERTAELKASEEKYRKLFENANVGMYRSKLDGSAFIAVNRKLAEIFESSIEETLAKPALLRWADPQKRADLVRELLQNGSVADYEIEVLTKNGTKRAGLASMQLFPEEGYLEGTIIDITERKQAEVRQSLTLEILRRSNEINNVPSLVGDILKLIKNSCGCDAVGLRLRSGDDFPYYEQQGFAGSFVKEENYLCAKDKEGNVLRNEKGEVVLECTCGLVVSGRTDPNKPYFTKGGSFWTNVSSELLELTAEEDPRTNPRNRCIHAGYQSVALVPLKSGEEITGLLQLNDRRKGRFTPELISFLEGLSSTISIALRRKQAHEALRANEERFRALFESSRDAIMTLEPPTWNFTSGNPATVAMFRAKDEKEFTSFEPWRLSPERQPDGRASSEKAGEMIETAMRDGSRLFEWTHQRLDGAAFPATVLLTRISYAGKTFLQATVRDITEQKRTEAWLIASEAGLKEAQRMAHIGNWDRNIGTNELHWSDEIYQIFGLQPQESGITYETFRNSVHPGDYEYVQKSVKESLHSGNPYDIDHRIVRPSGEVRIVHEQGKVKLDESGEPIRLIGTVQDITERKKAEDKLQETLGGLRKALGGIIQVLSSTTEKRDPYTAGHQKRVADLARAIGQEMGLSAERVEGLRLAGTIHDIGKVSIPAEILSKPTRLTEIEYKLIKSHSQVGFDILGEIQFSWPLAEMVLQHHERMNGSGYPRGLKGESILLEARILAVSDVVEAMASHRPYRPSLGLKVALEEIEKNSDVLYDTDVVSACLTLFKEKGFNLK